MISTAMFTNVYEQNFLAAKSKGYEKQYSLNQKSWMWLIDKNWCSSIKIVYSVEQF